MLKIPSFIKSHKRTQSGTRKQLDILPVDVEALTNDERISRQLHTGLRRKSSVVDRPRLFEWFLVIGVPPSIKETTRTANTTTTNISSNLTVSEGSNNKGKSSPPPLIKSTGNARDINGEHVVISKEKPKILFQYPPDKPIDNISVEYFPFPSGIPISSVSQTASHTNLFQMIYPQKHLKQHEDSFVFMLTDEKKQVLYGITTTKVSTIGSLGIDEKYQIDVDENPCNYDEYVQVGQTIQTAPKCYCILTRYPFLKLHFDVIKGALAIQHIQEITRFQNLISINRKPPKLTASIQLSTSMSTEVSSNSSNNSSDTNNNNNNNNQPILNLIEHFYQQSVLLHGQTLSFDVNTIYPQYNEKIEFTRGKLKDKDDITSDYSEYMLDYGLFVTLQLLTHKTIIIILNAILLEKRVVFYSKTPRSLTCIVLSIITLLKPFQYQSVILPLLPNSVSTLSIQDLLSAPVPYIIGLTSIPTDVDLSDIVLVDIDQNKIIAKSLVDLFPRWTILANKLIQVSNKLRNTIPSKSQINYIANKEQEVIISTFVESIETYLTKLFENFNRHCIRNVTQQKTISIFLKDSFIKTEFQSEEEQNWMYMFMETLIFSVYLDQKLRQKDNDLLLDDDHHNTNDNNIDNIKIESIDLNNDKKN